LAGVQVQDAFAFEARQFLAEDADVVGPLLRRGP
jgi:hypothetical protein